MIVIDDDRGLRELCRRALQNLVDVRTFEGLRQAEPHLAEADLVVTDLEMPDQDGRAVLACLRLRDLPARALVITGCDPMAANVRQVAETGVPILLKPFAIPDFVAHVCRLLTYSEA